MLAHFFGHEITVEGDTLIPNFIVDLDGILEFEFI